MRARTLFLSDVHLGFRRSRVQELAEFLRQAEAECIVLVGDIVDGLSMARQFYWAPEHSEVIDLLKAKRRAGARLIYLPGNHDAGFSLFADKLQGRLETHRQWEHRTERGERLLVVHGDIFEAKMSSASWLRRLGTVMYDATVAANGCVNDLRRTFRMPYWPMAERIKLSVSTSANYINHFESVAAAYARGLGYDGVVCGHIHRANLRGIEGVLYANTGDWVESCSALIEDKRGELRILRWPHQEEQPAAVGPSLVAGAA